MPELPDRPHLAHLKKQAKVLLRQYRDGDPAAAARFRDALPNAAAGGFHLHDAQSCIAREYGFPSWAELKSYVEARALETVGHDARVLGWLRLVYASDMIGGYQVARPVVAARMLAENPDLVKGDPYLACAVGDEAALRDAIRRDPEWVNRPGGPLNLLPLVAVTHSSLVRLPDFRSRVHRAAALLLAAGADPNQSVGSRSYPASLNHPSAEFPLSALYGAAGVNHDPELTKLLLDAGANPNDNESLYHSLENIECTRVLLEGGARIEGTNAMYRVLDLDKVDVLRLLLAHGGNPNEGATSSPTNIWGSPLFWAIRRRRSRAYIAALLQAGADPAVKTPDGMGAYSLALQYGLVEVAELLRQAGAEQVLTEEELFIAACSRGDEQEARRIQSARPDLPAGLSEAQLRLLPELAAEGCEEGVRLMVRLGWPIAVRGGDWRASALNLAVFRGDAPLTRFLLEHGASWREEHGFGDNVCGTLSWASLNEPVEGGDWLGCARALVAAGMPSAQPAPDGSDGVLVDGRLKRFSDEVTEFLLCQDDPLTA
jgi:ankyrin repeat protein